MKKWMEVVACKEENSKGVTGRVSDKGKRYGIEGKDKDPEGGRKRDSRSREGVRIGASRRISGEGGREISGQGKE